MAKPQNRDWAKVNLDHDFFLDSGLLFEINRQLLHPLGIAIIVTADEQGSKVWGFKDLRANPEKAVFDKATLELGRQKFERFLRAFGLAQMDRRTKKLGKVCQHVDSWVSS